MKMLSILIILFSILFVDSANSSRYGTFNADTRNDSKGSNNYSNVPEIKIFKGIDYSKTVY